MVSTEPQTDPHQAIRDRFADYADGALDSGQEQELEEHLSSCSECESAFEEFQREDVGISGLHRMSAPMDFEAGVKDTIRRRSKGRFFGRRAFGDRVPFELLAVLAILLAIATLILLYFGR